MNFEEYRPNDGMGVFKIGVYILELVVISATIYVMVACISSLIENSYVISSTNFMP